MKVQFGDGQFGLTFEEHEYKLALDMMVRLSRGVPKDQKFMLENTCTFLRREIHGVQLRSEKDVCKTHQHQSVPSSVPE